MVCRVPTRQVLRRDGAKRYYLDLYWDDYALGRWRSTASSTRGRRSVVGDALRQNSLVIDGDRVLRLPLLGLRLEPDAFFDQIEEGTGGGRLAA